MYILNVSDLLNLFGRCCQIYNKKIERMKNTKKSDNIVQLNLKITNCNLFFIAENNRMYIFQ